VIPGILLCAGVGLLATWIGGVQHIVGAPIIGLFLGIIIANTVPEAFLNVTKGGAAYSAKRVLRVGIILAGGTLSFKTILATGRTALPYIVFSMIVAFLVAYLIGKRMKVSGKTSVLVGGGTAICGGTAIATLSAVIEAREEETAYAMTAIFLFDILAALMWPYVALTFQFSPDQFGVLAGIAINDVASVTAAGETFNNLMGAAAFNASGVSGGDLSTIVKLTRVALLVVVVVIATIVHQTQVKKRDITAGNKNTSVLKSIIKSFPYYILGFLVLAICNTVFEFSSIALMGTNLSGILKTVYKYLITVAFTGVGFKVKFAGFFTKGAKPVLLGGCTWAVVSVCTLVYIVVFMA